jgi:hypothetical protein
MSNGFYSAYTSTRFDRIKSREIEIIDWGCGQALATCILIDYLIGQGIDLNVASILLIEPSGVALQCNHIQQMFQRNLSINSKIRAVTKCIDDLVTTDVPSDPDRIKVHLFSNIIDVEGFDLRKLYQLICHSFQGVNRIICTSPENSQQHRLEQFYRLFFQSHQIARASTSSEAIYGEVFYAASERFEQRKISRCEWQFTINLTQG